MCVCAMPRYAAAVQMLLGMILDWLANLAIETLVRVESILKHLRRLVRQLERLLLVLPHGNRAPVTIAISGGALFVVGVAGFFVADAAAGLVYGLVVIGMYAMALVFLAVIALTLPGVVGDREYLIHFEGAGDPVPPLRTSRARLVLKFPDATFDISAMQALRVEEDLS